MITDRDINAKVEEIGNHYYKSKEEHWEWTIEQRSANEFRFRLIGYDDTRGWAVTSIVSDWGNMCDAIVSLHGKCMERIKDGR